MRRRRFKRRLFWTGVIFALTLIWLTVQVMRAAGAIASATRGVAPSKTLQTHARRT
jgi:hypothetical protein